VADITLQILLNKSLAITKDARTEATRAEDGMIVAVFPALKYANPASGNRYAMWCQMGNPKFGYIHIKDVPDIFPEAMLIEKVNALLTKSMYVEQDVQDDPTMVMLDMVRKREFRILIPELPNNVRNTLLSDREVTVNWGQAKTYLRKKIITSKWDAALDDELTELLDEDLI